MYHQRLLRLAHCWTLLIAAPKIAIYKTAQIKPCIKPVIFKRVLLLDDTLFLSSLNLYTACEDSTKDKNRTAKTKQ